jgi:hypothetical protein
LVLRDTYRGDDAFGNKTKWGSVPGGDRNVFYVPIGPYLVLAVTWLERAVVKNSWSFTRIATPPICLHGVVLRARENGPYVQDLGLLSSCIKIPEVKRPEREDSPSSSVEVKKCLGFGSTPPIRHQRDVFSTLVTNVSVLETVDHLTFVAAAVNYTYIFL